MVRCLFGFPIVFEAARQTQAALEGKTSDLCHKLLTWTGNGKRAAALLWPRAAGFLSCLQQKRLHSHTQLAMYNAFIDAGANPTKILEAIEDSSLQADSMTYNSLIASHSKKNQIFKAQQLFLDMRRDILRPSTLACNILLAAGDAISEFPKMLQGKLEPNVVSYSTVISACQKQQKSQSALDLLWTMRVQLVLPNMVTCSAAISACGRHWKTAVWLFALMELDMVEQDVISYNAAISACEKGSKAGRARLFGLCFCSTFDLFIAII